MKPRIEKTGGRIDSTLGSISVWRIINKDGQGIAIRTESHDKDREGNARSGQLNISREGATYLVALLASALEKGKLTLKDSVPYKPKTKKSK